MGRIAAPYAVKGWVKLQTFTEYLDSLLDYPVWKLGRNGQWRDVKVLEAKVHGDSLVALLDGVPDRNKAETLRGLDVGVVRSELPDPDEDEYYWDELLGLEVFNLAGESLGMVDGLLETGAHDVLKVGSGGRLLIPFVEAIVREVDLDAGRIVVDWEKDYG